jgi:hypothetical protein
VKKAFGVLLAVFALAGVAVETSSAGFSDGADAIIFMVPD